MRLFFGSKKDKTPSGSATSSQVTDPNAGLPEAIQKNKTAIDTLDKRQKLLEKRIADEEEDAKRRVAAGDKRGALMSLKRKKMLETELENLMNSRMTLEQQINSLEAAQMNQIAVAALAHGVNVHKQLNKQIDADRVDQLMEDLQEQQELQDEIAQVMSSGNRIGDDEDLMKELEALESQQQDELLIGASNVPSGPVATASKQAVKAPAVASAPAASSSARSSLTEEEEAELAALQQSLN
jgi:charged multivesicular body protein 4